MINNNAYGGFIVSKNIILGKPIKYSFREKSNIAQLNGWNFYSAEDDEAYVNNADNFKVLNAESVLKWRQSFTKFIMRHMEQIYVGCTKREFISDFMI